MAVAAKTANPDDRVPHLRATPEQVREKWRKGFYTSKGYVHDLIEAFRRQGWWFRIENIKQFCSEWEIKERTFYRVKAELIAAGDLEEKIVGILEIRIPRGLPQMAEGLPQMAEGLPQMAEGLPQMAEGLPNLAKPIAEVVDMAEVRRSPNFLTDLDQLNTTFFLEQAREKDLDSNISGSSSIAQPAATEPAIVPSRSTCPPVNKNPVEAKPIGVDNSSAARFEEKFKNRQHSVLPAWRSGRGINDWNESVVEGLRRWLDFRYPKQPPHSRGDAIAYIAKRENPDHPGHAVLLARCQEIAEGVFASKPGKRDALAELEALNQKMIEQGAYK